MDSRKGDLAVSASAISVGVAKTTSTCGKQSPASWRARRWWMCRVAREVGDDQKVHVAPVVDRALGVGAEEHDPLGGEGADQALTVRWTSGGSSVGISTHLIVDQQQDIANVVLGQ